MEEAMMLSMTGMTTRHHLRFCLHIQGLPIRWVFLMQPVIFWISWQCFGWY